MEEAEEEQAVEVERVLIVRFSKETTISKQKCDERLTFKAIAAPKNGGHAAVCAINIVQVMAHMIYDHVYEDLRRNYFSTK